MSAAEETHSALLRLPAQSVPCGGAEGTKVAFFKGSPRRDKTEKISEERVIDQSSDVKLAANPKGASKYIWNRGFIIQEETMTICGQLSARRHFQLSSLLTTYSTPRNGQTREEREGSEG